MSQAPLKTNRPTPTASQATLTALLILIPSASLLYLLYISAIPFINAALFMPEARQALIIFWVNNLFVRCLPAAIITAYLVALRRTPPPSPPNIAAFLALGTLPTAYMAYVIWIEQLELLAPGFLLAATAALAYAAYSTATQRRIPIVLTRAAPPLVLIGYTLYLEEHPLRFSIIILLLTLTLPAFLAEHARHHHLA